MKSAPTLILNAKQIQQKIDRIAYQVYENNFEEKEIIIAGIASRGYVLAQKLAEKLKDITKIKIVLAEITVDKENPIKQDVKLSIKPEVFGGKVVILVDDVLNSGKTLIYGMAPFLSLPVKRITTVILVDRNHNRYPIKADFVGISLATTLQDHITVDVAKSGKEAVYLT
jgi:pyrimidine operon attenuation protein/uracil phosphoribosyltransferase